VHLERRFPAKRKILRASRFDNDLHAPYLRKGSAHRGRLFSWISVAVAVGVSRSHDRLRRGAGTPHGQREVEGRSLDAGSFFPVRLPPPLYKSIHVPRTSRPTFSSTCTPSRSTPLVLPAEQGFPPHARAFLSRLAFAASELEERFVFSRPLRRAFIPFRNSLRTRSLFRMRGLAIVFASADVFCSPIQEKVTFFFPSRTFRVPAPVCNMAVSGASLTPSDAVRRASRSSSRSNLDMKALWNALLFFQAAICSIRTMVSRSALRGFRGTFPETSFSWIRASPSPLLLPSAL